MYEELIESSRVCAMRYNSNCDRCLFCGMSNDKNGECYQQLHKAAADAIEELLKVVSAMHTWIFLHTGDEQSAYDECGLTDEMNAELGYGGQFVIEPPKGET